MTAGLCRTCGKVVHPGDQFCGNCGASVGELASGIEADDDDDVSPQVRPLPNPIAVAQMPTVPPPVGAPLGTMPVTTAVTRIDSANVPKAGEAAAVSPPRRSGRSLRLLAGALVVVLFAAIAGLTLALIGRNTDLDNEKAKLAQTKAALDNATAATSTTDASANPEVELKNQLAQVTAALDQAKTDLTAEKQGRADDAAAAQAAAAAAATQASSDVAAAQAAQAAAEQQVAAMQAAFPVSAATITAANPNGTYTAMLTPGECTLALCSTLAPLSITIADPLAISGDRVSGTLAFDGTTYVNSGPLELAKSPQCASVDQASTYLLSLHTTAITVVDGAVHAAKLEGTYTETITAGDCAGQHRSYTVTMSRD